MSRLVAMCGLLCNECQAYIATRDNDLAAKAKIAAEWSSEDFPLKAEDIFCDGCVPAGGRILSFCTACEARQCGLERGVENCAHCADYACAKLEKVWGFLSGSEAKAMLDQIRAQR